MYDNLTATYVRSILDYDSETGDLVWKVNRGQRALKGKIAGSHDREGYKKITINGISYRAHRIIWLWITGNWPISLIDHINGIRDDNTIDNLRESNHQQNQRNQKKPMNNTSGYKGVSWNKCNKIWSSNICLGSFKTKEEAAEAYNKAAEKLFGEYARLNEINL